MLHDQNGETLSIYEWLSRAGFKNSDVFRMEPELIRHLHKQWFVYREIVQTCMSETGCSDPGELEINHPYRTPQVPQPTSSSLELGDITAVYSYS
ncbi:MAG: hypothetical protein HC836_18945 [Richelia sp. RM2_1_2]|nr:hypothetical protein [Richelia sp. SM2_1_7]NJM17419.1 hypothetical protein [Richelia sp. SM1_7_0]NJN09359.1 hypothetical protein [Richelia sp. RM1_1_1]NJO26469.1 hypothetical protein [Richelia sp. SL_2_1]NJO60267.1 hypothetical protein [Richelia sp. RM2_1_2]